MNSDRLHALERLLITANALLTSPTCDLSELEAYGEERERVFARLWDQEFHSAGEKAVVDCFVEGILLKSTLIAAKAWSLRMAAVGNERSG